ncbi:MAG: hypothetical protein R2881_04055 [Eubacteriales bacterium]
MVTASILLALPEPVDKPVDTDAATLMAQILEASEEPVVLIPTGRFTNIAAAVASLSAPEE